MQSPQGAAPGVQGQASTGSAGQGPVAPDLALLLSTIFHAQADAQMAQANTTTNANFITFHTVWAQVLVAKSRDKDSKLTVAKQWILKACAGHLVLDDFEVQVVYPDMATEEGYFGNTSSQSCSACTRPTSTSPLS